jgi:dTDP-4-dehydrorhamnose reductase
MKKVAIIGSAGQLGTDLAAALYLNKDIELFLLDHSSVECADKLSVEKALFNIHPDLVINCAAFVRVDVCEVQPERAYSVNARGAGHVAQACSDIDATVVYISTDYVFDGGKSSPYAEEDPPNPLNVYGKSKLEGETFVGDLCPKHFIVRSSGLYGLRQGSKGGLAWNFVETMLKLADKGGPIRVVDDQTLAPTFTKDLAGAIAELIETDRYGTYHITNSGECSWYEFGKAVLEISGLSPDYGRISSKEYGARALRPAYSVLDNSLIHQLGIAPLRAWGDALREYLELRSHA